ncbi:MAG: efflux RND transporter permease subunit [Deltaproteobacteria bacterium]|jgi:CzcA family heavy metal efflux pump|nr:efflux RND transporter permease subunit [Deltaproteobacteria bacterium]MBW2533487.1 efflux RND transporter permease subunit [Deltaproteobacteria bacterium]
MLDALIKGSLRHRWLVVVAAMVLAGVGTWIALRMPVDVLPDLTAPSVTVVTEAEGMAPQEVEQLITVPLEQALRGSSGVRRVRSSSATGFSLVWVEFDWDVDQLPARQVVGEKLAAARGALPQGVEPYLAPASSIMGEVMFIGLVGKEGVSAGELRDTAEWTVRRRLLGVPGVAEIVTVGGDVKQVQITLRPEQMLQHRVGAEDVLGALEGVSDNAPGGFHVAGPQEYLIRGVGRLPSLDALGLTAVARRDGVPIMLRDVATLGWGPELKRADAAVDGTPAVVLKIQKQPEANSLELTKRLDQTLDEIGAALPDGMELYRKGFRQADFIRVAIGNVTSVLRDGALLVVVVLVLLMMSWRTTLITVLALPLSLLAGIVVLRLSDASINTMTLGGFAIAIGELVDNAIIFVENIHRRLRQNALRPPDERQSTFDTVYQAAIEIRGSVLVATAIILLVFAPLFFLSGIEGRLLRPLGLAFVTSIAASLLVALTITPALCMLLLGKATGGVTKPSAVARFLERRYRPVVEAVLRVPIPIGVASLCGIAAAAMALGSFGRTFLPEFNEGSLNIAAATAPGTSLQTSDRLVRRLETFLLHHPAVTSVLRTTGRAERDEHAMDVNYSELEVGLDVASGDRERVFREIRQQAAAISGLSVNVGQPISHRVEHLVSGVRSSIALKVFGEDFDQLRMLASAAKEAMASTEGLVDLGVEQQTDIPQIVIRPKAAELAALGMTPGELARFVEMSLVGRSVGRWWEGERVYDLVAKLPDGYRNDLELLRSIPVDVGGERLAELSSVARIDKTLGPNLINRENGQRRILVTANVAGRDLRGAATDAASAVERQVERPAGYHIVLGGQFESEARARRAILALSALAVLGIAALLYLSFRSVRDVAIVMLNLPLASVGGAVAVWLGGGVMSIASLVGFITLFGIATRNGVMLVSHYRRLLTVERLPLHEAVVQGSVDRLLPILMTAVTAALALIPIVLATGEPGNEIQAPLAAVILGGLTSSTLLNLVVIPTLFARFSKTTTE